MPSSKASRRALKWGSDSSAAEQRLRAEIDETNAMPTKANKRSAKKAKRRPKVTEPDASQLASRAPSLEQTVVAPTGPLGEMPPDQELRRRLPVGLRRQGFRILGHEPGGRVLVSHDKRPDRTLHMDARVLLRRLGA